MNFFSIRAFINKLKGKKDATSQELSVPVHELSVPAHELSAPPPPPKQIQRYISVNNDVYNHWRELFGLVAAIADEIIESNSTDSVETDSNDSSFDGFDGGSSGGAGASGDWSDDSDNDDSNDYDDSSSSDSDGGQLFI